MIFVWRAGEPYKIEEVKNRSYLDCMSIGAEYVFYAIRYDSLDKIYSDVIFNYRHVEHIDSNCYILEETCNSTIERKWREPTLIEWEELMEEIWGDDMSKYDHAIYKEYLVKTRDIKLNNLL